MIGALKGEEQKKVARRILCPIILWKELWGQKKDDLYGDPYGEETILHQDFCRMLTPDPIVKLFADDIIDPMLSSE